MSLDMVIYTAQEGRAAGRLVAMIHAQANGYRGRHVVPRTAAVPRPISWRGIEGFAASRLQQSQRRLYAEAVDVHASSSYRSGRMRRGGSET